MHATVIQLHRQAPAKPSLGQPCNGCGACCALEPCPVGAVISLRRSGACVALEWNEAQLRYQCGLLTKSEEAGAPARKLVARWIAAGQGCDADLELDSAAPPAETAEAG